MARTPMPAPVPLESPAVRRSAMLAKLLEESRQPVEIKGGYGELGARLLAQGINQWGANKAEKAVRGERQQLMNTQRDSLLAALGGPPPSAPSPMGAALAPTPAPAMPTPPMPTNTQEPVSSPIAPAAQIAGGPLPAVGESMPTPTPAPMAAPMAAPAPQAAAPMAAPAPVAPRNPLGPTPQEIELIRQAASSGDPGQLAWAQQTWAEIQMRQATPPEIDIAIGPDGTPYNTNDPSALNQRFRRVENINGFLTDVNDPANINRFRPDIGEGEEPVYDGQGNVIGVRNLSGAIQARGERARTDADAANASRASYAGITAGAEAAARAPYQFTTVVGPDGQPITLSASQAAGGVFEGQRPADAIFAEGGARNQVAAIESARVRASAGERILPSLATMEALLPDVISGFGAEQRLGIDRARAAVGDDAARRRVTATQTFQNEARQVVSGILPLFGANPTEGERKYAEQMSGADVTLTPESLSLGINLARARIARDQAAYQQAQGGQGGQGGGARPRATNPQTGQVVEFDGQAWVPVR